MNQVETISELLGEELSIPVFQYTLPDNYEKKCVVVNEIAYDYQMAEGEYHIDIYAPNRERTIDGNTDLSLPDMDAIIDIRRDVFEVLRNYWNSDFDLNIIKSQLTKSGFMHYLNICLTIQFN